VTKIGPTCNQLLSIIANPTKKKSPLESNKREKQQWIVTSLKCQQHVQALHQLHTALAGITKPLQKQA
jgi:hypothetical protein